jgi:hypothetical protein
MTTYQQKMVSEHVKLSLHSVVGFVSISENSSFGTMLKISAHSLRASLRLGVESLGVTHRDEPPFGWNAQPGPWNARRLKWLLMSVALWRPTHRDVWSCVKSSTNLFAAMSLKQLTRVDSARQIALMRQC